MHVHRLAASDCRLKDFQDPVHLIHRWRLAVRDRNAMQVHRDAGLLGNRFQGWAVVREGVAPTPTFVGLLEIDDHANAQRHQRFEPSSRFTGAGLGEDGVLKLRIATSAPWQ
jgi:hypothetical protein